MKIKNTSYAAILSLIFVLAVTGCAKKADPNKPIEQIQSEVQSMSVNDLKSTAQAYAKEIMAKKSEVDQVSDKVKQLSPTELFGDKAKTLKDELSKIGSQVSALNQRYQIYAQKFQEKGGDLSAIKIG